MRFPIDPKAYNSHNPFGQYDPDLYITTKHHIGSDFPRPIGTPIAAPKEGEMFKTLTTEFKGNVGIYIFTHKDLMWGLELCHLRELPLKKKYYEGDIIAFTGNTGVATTGPHLHMVMHRNATVTKNYQELVNEEAFVRLWREGRIVDPYLYFWNNKTVEI